MTTPMYPAIVNSPITTLRLDITPESTIIPVVDINALPPAPNLACIGDGDDIETVLYTGKSGDNLVDVTRGFQGQAQSWTVGTSVSRNFTAYDHDTFKENIEYLADALNNLNTELTSHLADYANPHKVPGKNLLHNWDFRNPVNQRGQSSYTGIAYAIDRFKISSGVTLDVNIGYISLTSTYQYASLTQIIEGSKSLLAGKTVTLSIKCKKVSGGTIGLAITDSTNISNYYIRESKTVTSAWNTYFVTVQIPSDITNDIMIAFYADYSGTGVVCDVESIKLELGSVSTLANDPPADYGEELAKCRRYLYKINDYPRFRADRIHPNQFEFFIPLGVEMRVNPSIINPANLQVTHLDGSTIYTGFTFTLRKHPNGVTIIASKTGHGYTDALLFVASDGILLSAEL